MASRGHIRVDAQEFQRITNVSRETFHLYMAWYNLLTHWNKRINLVSSSTLHNYWLRHALDSWQVFADDLPVIYPPSCVIPEEGGIQSNNPIPNNQIGGRPQTKSGVTDKVSGGFNVLDLGAGAGFPGLAAAIHFRDVPEAHVYLVEANGKKCNFLRAVIRELGLPATVIAARAENVPDKLKHKHFNIITARAFAPLPKLLGYCAPYWSVDTQTITPSFQCKLESGTSQNEELARPQIKSEETEGEGAICGSKSVGTLGIFAKGRNWQVEVKAARKDWDFDLETHQSQTDEDAKILWVQNLAQRGKVND